MSKLTIGPWVAAQKLPSKDLALDRQAFLERGRADSGCRCVHGAVSGPLDGAPGLP